MPIPEELQEFLHLGTESRPEAEAAALAGVLCDKTKGNKICWILRYTSDGYEIWSALIADALAIETVEKDSEGNTLLIQVPRISVHIGVMRVASLAGALRGLTGGQNPALEFLCVADFGDSTHSVLLTDPSPFCALLSGKEQRLLLMSHREVLTLYVEMKVQMVGYNISRYPSKDPPAKRATEYAPQSPSEAFRMARHYLET